MRSLPTCHHNGVRLSFYKSYFSKFSLTVLDRTIESETCKIVENSYRTTLLAFLDEWSVFS